MLSRAVHSVLKGRVCNGCQENYVRAAKVGLGLGAVGMGYAGRDCAVDLAESNDWFLEARAVTGLYTEPYLVKHWDDMKWHIQPLASIPNQVLVDQMDLPSTNYDNLTMDQIVRYHEKINMDDLLRQRQFTEQKLASNWQVFSKYGTAVSHYQNLSEEFMRDNYANLNWQLLTRHQFDNMSWDFMIQFKDQLDREWLTGQAKIQSNLEYGFQICPHELLRRNKYSVRILEQHWNKLKGHVVQILNNQELTNRFVQNHWNDFKGHIPVIIQKYTLDQAFIRDHWDELKDYVVQLVQRDHLSREVIMDHWDDVKAHADNVVHKLTPEFILEHLDDFTVLPSNIKLPRLSVRQLDENWSEYSQRPKYVAQMGQLTEEFMERHQRELPWDLLTRHQKMSMRFLGRFKDRVDWTYLLEQDNVIEEFKKMPEELLDMYLPYVSSNWLANKRQLSTEFMDQYLGVNWSYNPVRAIRRYFVVRPEVLDPWLASRTQEMTEDQIERFIRYVDMEYLSKKKLFSVEFQKKYGHLINYNDNMLYMTLEERMDRLREMDVEERMEWCKILKQNGLGVFETVSGQEDVQRIFNAMGSNRPGYVVDSKYLYVRVKMDDLKQVTGKDRLGDCESCTVSEPIQPVKGGGGHRIRITNKDIDGIDLSTGAIYCSTIKTWW